MDGAGLPRIKSTCAYCGVGCGVILTPGAQDGLTVEGDPGHPANYGRLCSKGLALGETVGLADRLLAPQVGGVDTDWDTALDLVADRFQQTIAEHGPDSVAFYLSGQLLTEDYYVANKLMKGFIGSANVDTNSRLCMASTVAGHKRAFGSDTVPGTYEDLEEADLVVLVGSNLAWCHPVLYQRLAAARQARGTKVVVIDPRRTATCDIADLHLRLKAGSDVALFNGLFAHLRDVGALDADFIIAHTDGFDATYVSAAATETAVTGLDRRDLDRFYALFAATEKTVTVFSQGVNQSTVGTDKVNAIINCHLATGRIGKPGMGPLSVTGQPNAMGGREVGGLANTLAAHLELDNAAHRASVQSFWDAPRVADRGGLKAVEMFEAVHSGRIKAIWITCTNPVVSLPEADRVAEALQACDFVVVSDIMARTDTTRYADVLLPALGFGEKDGTVTNSDRVISRQRAALPAPGAALPDWDIFARVGQRMGWTAAFNYHSPSAIFREHAALSRIAAGLGRDFDLSGLTDLDDEGYADLAPVRWPVTANGGATRLFGNGSFFTPNGRAHMVPVTHRAPAARRSPRYPFRLNTGRIRDQWHTMTRSGLSPRLQRHLAEPFVQIHPHDAATLGLAAADLAQLDSPTGRAVMRVLITEDVSPGHVFAPMHWTAETASAARVGTLIAGAVDPISGQPESKAAICAVSRWDAAWFGFAVSRAAVTPNCAYWAKARTAAGWRVELAGEDPITDWEATARALFGRADDPAILSDRQSGLTRIAFVADGILEAALFVAPRPVAVSRDFVAASLGQPADDPLAGRPAAGCFDPGPTVCSCMNVGRNTLLAAIATEGPDLDRLCVATGAGTNCGSCRPEIADLIARAALPTAAE